jgi:hypothetical protein
MNKNNNITKENNMNLKKITIIGIIFIFLLSFITHSIYDWFPSFLTSIFFPVNESIWEHMKMIFTASLIWGLVEYFILKKKDIDYFNIASATVLSVLFNIVIFLIIYVPIYIKFGENLIVTLIIYFITIVLSQIMAYNILKTKKHLKKLNVLSFILIPLIFIIFGLLTYFPLKIDTLFFDYNDHK